MSHRRFLALAFTTLGLLAVVPADAQVPPPTRPNVTVPAGARPTTLQITDITVGTGAEATEGQTVEVHYVGVAWSTGQTFDASWDRHRTFRFRLGQHRVIQGWERGVAGMHVGGRRQLIIPPSLAYGEHGVGSVIHPYETLIFVIDLVSVQ